MRKNKLSERLEIRVDAPLLKNLNLYCAKYGIKQSEVLRDALAFYVEYGSLKFLLLDSAHQDAQFRKAFKKFLTDCPKSLKIFFEKFLGTEEEKNSLTYALNISGIMDSFVTEQGKKAYQKRCGKNA